VTACDGYIVQKIDFYKSTATCSQLLVAASPAKPVLTFWEAWPVAKGDQLFKRRSAIGYTDQSGWPSASGSGTVTATGEIKFFCKTVTGDLGDLNKTGTDKNWGPGLEPQSVSLPSTHKQPSWWSKAPVGGPANRMASTWWNCCGDAKSHSSDAMFDP
jgi:hypothetical protein